MQVRHEHVEVGSDRLHVAHWGDGPADIVLLHDGLGSIALWRDVPERIAVAAGATVMVYERAGHGTSRPIPNGAWPLDWLERQADTLGDVLATMATERPLLVGHSDGGSIALIHASRHATSLCGVVALAAHGYVERCCSDEIASMRNKRDAVVAGLSHHHDHPAELFEAWSARWVSPEFAIWNIVPALASIDVAAVVVQGTDDAYATDDMALALAAAIGSNATCLLLDGLGHLLPRDAPGAVVDSVVDLRRRAESDQH